MKKVISIVLVLLMILAVAGFASAEDKQVETVIWTDSQSLEEGIVKAAEAFMELNPNVKITVEAFPGSERPEKLALAKESGTLPALFLTAFFTSADEVHQGTILPVTELINGAHAGNISQTALDSVKIAEDYYMVPTFTSSQGLLYNADMFKAAGLEKYVTESPDEIACWTLNDFENEILPALKNHLAGSEKYVMTMYAANAQNDSYLHNLLRIYDGNIFTDGFCTAGDDAQVVKALAKVKEWIDLGYTNADVNTRLWTDCNADFRNQVCAISAGQFQSYLNHLAAFESGSAEKFDVRVAAIPCVKADGTDSGAMHMYTYGFALMNVAGEQLAVARDFLTWLAAPDSAKYIPAMINGVPTITAVMELMGTAHPIYAAYQDAEKYMFDFTGNAPGWVATRTVFYPEMQAAFSGEKEPHVAMADYEEAANEIITEFAENSLVLSK